MQETSAAQRTLVLLKPDALRRNLRGEIIRRFEQRGYDIVALNQRMASELELHKHYSEHVGKPFFEPLLGYMTSGPVLALVVEGTECVQAIRNLLGATKPTDAAPGTIRGDLGRAWDRPAIENLVHASDSEESAEREIAIWFPELAHS